MSLNRYADYEEMDQYGESILSKVRRLKAIPEPSAIDHLAAVAAPHGEAARRILRWESWQKEQAGNRELLDKLFGALPRFEFKIDVGVL